MPLWKPLLIVLPAGMALGMVGGHLARPIMAQRVTDDPTQSMFQTRADRYGLAASSADQAQDGLGYVGGYSYQPGSASSDANWAQSHEYAYAGGPLPSVAELDARQAALLADPDVEFAVSPAAVVGQPSTAGQSADLGTGLADQPETDAVTSVALETAPEPRKADGEPAIW
jgi:hypothetical protein